ncbi:MAG: hypothetical protein ABR591_16075 [Candidatus Velthaea sp.]
MTPSIAGWRGFIAALALAVPLGLCAVTSAASASDEPVAGPPPVDVVSVPADQPSAAPQASSSPNAAASAPPASPPVNTEAAPAPRGTAAPSRGGRAAFRKFEHWEIAPTLMQTWSTGKDIVPPGPRPFTTSAGGGNTLPLDVLRLTGEARYRFNNRLGLQFQRIDHTGATGRVRPTRTGGTFGGHSEDYEERFLGTYAFNSYFAARAGYAMRTRTCCPAAGAFGNRNPRIHTGFFSDIAWRFGPNTIGGKPISTSFRWEEYRHHPVNPPTGDQGVKPTFSFTTYSNFFLYHQTKFVPYYGIEYFSTYFSYAPAMSETFRKVYGVAYRATRDLSYRVYVKNDQSGGILASSGDSAHKSTLFGEATYRFHF